MPEVGYCIPLGADLELSFQRYAFPESGFLRELPISLGALPVIGTAQRRLSVPSPVGEALWIGLVSTGRPLGAAAGRPAVLVRVLAVSASGQRWDAAPGGLRVPPFQAVAGIPREEGGWWAIALDVAGTPGPGCVRLELEIRSGPMPLQTAPPPQAPPATPSDGTSWRVDLVRSGDYEALAGSPLPPLEPGAGYQGNRLP